MSLNVNNQTSALPYSENPLVRPLVNFHGVASQIFKGLPQDGKAFEIAKRVAIAVIAPFAYLALSLLALVGIAFHSFFQDTTLKNVGSTNTIAQRGPEIDVENELKISEDFIIRKIGDYPCIKSFKLFLDIVCDDKKYQAEQAISSPNTSDNYGERMFRIVTSAMLNTAKNALNPGETAKLNIEWEVLLKYQNDDEESYAQFSVSNKGNFARQLMHIQSSSYIDPTKIQDFINVHLEYTKRPLTTQVDANGNFI